MPEVITGWKNRKAERIELPDSLNEAARVGGGGTLVYYNADTGAEIEALVDDKFPWAERKEEARRLAQIYGEISRRHAAERRAEYGRYCGDEGWGKLAQKVGECSTWLEYFSDGKRRTLHRFNACHSRLCPICATRRAKQRAKNLRDVLAKTGELHPEAQYLFLTLTVRNVAGGDLSAELNEMMSAWGKLYRRRPVARAVKGWFRALEITRNGDGTFHPHFHCVLAVEPGYFRAEDGGQSELYITQEQWAQMWRECLKADYTPVVDVRAAYAKNGKPGRSAALSAAVEAAKYAVKSCDYIGKGLSMDEACEAVEAYTVALRGRRLTGMGGWLKEAADVLKVDMEEDGDLVHIDDDEAGELTEQTAPYIETYAYYWRVCNYLLVTREDNPSYLGGEQISDSGGGLGGQAPVPGGGDFCAAKIQPLGA